MGRNHLTCATPSSFISTLPVHRRFTTHSADNDVTDSTAAATAFSCGQKTNNYHIGILPSKDSCQTLTELGDTNGLWTGIYTTDEETGATPASFFAHTIRSDKKGILADLKKARQTLKTDFSFRLNNLEENVLNFVQKALHSQKPFFLVVEQAHIDKASHNNNYEQAMNHVIDLDNAVKKTVSFLKDVSDVTIVVVADHETGGLTQECRFTTMKHTSQSVDLYATGKNADVFNDVSDNTDVYARIKKILNIR